MRAIVCALLLTACAKDLSELAPFPCADDSSCPDGFTCRGTQCVAGGCASVSFVAECSACGAISPVSCGGEKCRANAECIDDRCMCPAGTEEVDCSGAPCDDCAADASWCAPIASPKLSCDRPPFGAIATCSCADGRTYTTECGEAVTCTERCERCDLVDQTCAAGERCVVEDTNYDNIVCRDREAEERGLGEPCSNGACAPAMICSERTDEIARCRRYCYDDVHCAAEERCLLLGDLGGVHGECVSTCALFGDDCPAGRKCEAGYAAAPTLEGLAPFVMYCERAGSGQRGTECEYLDDCATGLTCSYEFLCVPYCDDTHPCDRGSCRRYGLPANGGWCSE